MNGVKDLEDRFYLMAYLDENEPMIDGKPNVKDIDLIAKYRFNLKDMNESIVKGFTF